MLPAQSQEPLPTAYNHWTINGSQIWATFHRIDGGYLVRFPGLADFEIKADGQLATCHPCPGVSPTTCEHLFLNQIWPLMLSRQGKLVFHASAVEEGTGALAFAAASGRGKSTLAAAFAAAGARYISDDGLAIERCESIYMAHPGHPSIRLWEDSRAALLKGNVTTAAPVFYTSKKRIVSATGLNQCAEPRRLAAAFFLGDGVAGEIDIHRVTGADAVAAWVAHSFILDTEDAIALHRHFNEIVMLAERVPCYRLDYPRCYDALDEVRAAILEAVSPKEPDT